MQRGSGEPRRKLKYGKTATHAWLSAVAQGHRSLQAARNNCTTIPYPRPLAVPRASRNGEHLSELW